MDTLNWEEILNDTETAARSASAKADRIVGGVAETLQVLNQHVSQHKKLLSKLDQIEQKIAALPLDQSQARKTTRPTNLHQRSLAPLIAAFTAGGLFGALSLNLWL